MARLGIQLLLLCFCCVATQAAEEVINPAVKIKQADRVVDIVTQLVKTTTQLVFENTGKDSVNSVLYMVENDAKDYLAFFTCTLIEGKLSKPHLKIQKVNVKDHSHSGHQFFKIDLLSPLASGKTVTVAVETVFSHYLVAHPAQITQKEKQLVIFKGNHFILSPYPIVKQTTRVNLGTRNIESYSKLKPVALSENTIVYGPYENVPEFSHDPLSVHYENNSPFLTIRNLERHLEVSHWGNIAVEETVNLEHTGAKLIGPFSRFEYQRESQSGLSSVKSFKTILPASATEAYYRDDIGNISTSNMRVLSDAVELNLRPRFPLFGGWKTHYVIGYNVPSYEYLYHSGDQYLLKIRFVDHVFDDMVVDDAVTKIILPEGSKNIKVKTPYPIERLPDSLHFTYLDTKGRPVVVLHKTGLVENHIQDVQVLYEFPHLLMFQEALLLVVALYLLFVLVIIYVRLDFSISKDEASENRLRVAGHVEKILNHQNKRLAAYDALDEQLNKLKHNKDMNGFNNELKSINTTLKNSTQAIADLIVKLKADGPEVAEKISELQKLDKALKEVTTHQHNLYVEKVVPGKINRASFLELDGPLTKKKAEYREKINMVIKNLQH